MKEHTAGSATPGHPNVGAAVGENERDCTPVGACEGATVGAAVLSCCVNGANVGSVGDNDAHSTTQTSRAVQPRTLPTSILQRACPGLPIAYASQPPNAATNICRKLAHGGAGVGAADGANVGAADGANVGVGVGVGCTVVQVSLGCARTLTVAVSAAATEF